MIFIGLGTHLILSTQCDSVYDLREGVIYVVEEL